MGEWKVSITLRIRPALRVEMEQFAAGEQRSRGNMGALLLEWAFAQLQAAGSTDRLLKQKIFWPEGARRDSATKASHKS
jgi:hypothetical protein